MARAAEQHVNSGITCDVGDGEKLTPLLRSLHELKRDELVVICQNLEQSLRNRDRQIDEINKHCEDLMRLYYDTIETLAARNKELHLFQDQLKQYEELTRCQDKLKQRECGDSPRQSTPREDQADYDSGSLTSGNTDPELTCLPNEEEDNADAEDSDDDDDNDDEESENSDDDDEKEDDRDGAAGESLVFNEAGAGKQTDASKNSSDGLALDTATSITTLVHSGSRTSKLNDGDTSKGDSKLSRSLVVDLHGKPAKLDWHKQASKLPVPNAAARARRHSKHLAISCQNLCEKVHPVLHRRDPNKSLYDVMIADLASVHSNKMATATTKNVRRWDDERLEMRNCDIEIKSWKSDLALDRTSPPTAMKELLSDQETDLVESNSTSKERVDETERLSSGECSEDKAQSSTLGDTQAVVQDNGDGTADKDEAPAPLESPTENHHFKLNQSDGTVISSPAVHRSSPILCSKSLETNSFRSGVESCPLANSIQLPQVKPVPSPRSTLLKHNTESTNLRTFYKPILSDEPVYSKISPRTISSAASSVSPQIPRDSILNNNANCKSYAVSIGRSVEKDSLEYITSHK